MIDKQEFYHGAAIVRLLEDKRCHNIGKHEFGYIVNNDVYIFLKYRTKSRSPWTFCFSREENRRLNEQANAFKKIIIVLICGGDGICAILLQDAETILGYKEGRITVKRKFNEQYGVYGTVGALKGKISLQKWPGIVFDKIQ